MPTLNYPPASNTKFKQNMLVKVQYINEDLNEMGLKVASMKKKNKFTIVVDKAGAEAEDIDISDLTQYEKGDVFELDLDKYEISRDGDAKWADLCIR